MEVVDDPFPCNGRIVQFTSRKCTCITNNNSRDDYLHDDNFNETIADGNKEHTDADVVDFAFELVCLAHHNSLLIRVTASATEQVALWLERHADR